MGRNRIKASMYRPTDRKGYQASIPNPIAWKDNLFEPRRADEEAAVQATAHHCRQPDPLHEDHVEGEAVEEQATASQPQPHTDERELEERQEKIPSASDHRNEKHGRVEHVQPNGPQSLPHWAATGDLCGEARCEVRANP